jgi:hypothetical protein
MQYELGEFGIQQRRRGTEEYNGGFGINGIIVLEILLRGELVIDLAEMSISKIGLTVF